MVKRRYVTVYNAHFVELTFHRLQVHLGHYVYRAVIHHYLQEEKHLLDAVAAKGGNISESFDGQCDSPGHCAKFEWSSMYDNESGTIIMIQLVQVSIYNFCIQI